MPTNVFLQQVAFAQDHPGVYAYLSAEGQEWDLPSATRVAELADNQDTSSAEPALYWQANGIPNMSVVAEIDGSSYRLQIYTVQAGTHEGKRIVKATDGFSPMRAVGFVNRNATFRPWNSSIWSSHTKLHEICADIISRPATRRAFATRSLSSGDFYSLSLGNYRCLVCNAETPDERQLCIDHSPRRADREVIGRVELHSSVAHSYEVAREADQVFVGAEERVNHFNNAIAEGVLASPTTAITSEVPSSTSRRRPRRTSTPAPHESGLPLLSQLNTGKVR